MSEFKVGDRVSVFYVNQNILQEEIGTVLFVIPGGGLSIEGSDKLRGRYFHPRQCDLVERPKKTVKKKMWAGVGKRSAGGRELLVSDGIYETRQQALSDGYIGSVEFEIEIEE